MANGTLTKIETVTVGAGGQSSIAFSSIPATYDDLKIVLSSRSSTASSVAVVAVTLNSDTTDANYTYQVLYSSNTTIGAEKNTSSRFASFYINADSSTASIFSTTDIYIANYRSSYAKGYHSDSVAEINTTARYNGLNASIWTGTSAVTSISLTCSAGNFMQHTTATLYGITRVPTGAKATGGVITDDANYWYHTFTTTGVFTPTQSLSCDYLVIAGGGGGGGSYGGGGGAGGLRSSIGTTGGGGSLQSAISVTGSTNYTITVGAGGTGGSNSVLSTSGSASSFSTVSTVGGGKGADNSAAGFTAGALGGSGGGASYTNTTGGGRTVGEGYAAGNGTGGVSAGSGGGGAGASSNNVGATNGIATDGGAGVAISALSTVTNTGVNNYYAGGGGGGATVGGGAGTYAGAGGAGGGGAGSLTAGGNGVSGTANTGGGGGGSGYITPAGVAGNGGSGLVIIRYAK